MGQLYGLIYDGIKSSAAALTDGSVYKTFVFVFFVQEPVVETAYETNLQETIVIYRMLLHGWGQEDVNGRPCRQNGT